jgi:hypothetical protein
VTAVQNVVKLAPETRVAPDDTVKLLRALLAHARAGRITGTVIAWRCRDGKFSGMTSGIYATDTIAALGAASKLWSQINDASSEE